jgi:hypothetical protein
MKTPHTQKLSLIDILTECNLLPSRDGPWPSLNGGWQILGSSKHSTNAEQSQCLGSSSLG